jgi:pSer/pThr/pTyr-binding forkhead associated (FHA) protein
VGAGDPTPGPTPSIAPEAIVLRVTEGPATGNLLRVGAEELLIGRQAPGQGKLGNDIEISRRHARVTRSGDGSFVIEDLGSTNGTFVNGDRITGARVLQAGDKLEMGDTKLTVEVPEPIEDKLIAPTGAPPAVTTFAAIPPQFAAAPEPAVDEPTGQSEAAAPEADAALEAVDRADAALADAAEAAPAEPEPVAEPDPAADPEPEAETTALEPEAAAPAPTEPESAPEPEPESAPEPEPEPEPAAPLLVASSGPISVRVEGTHSGDLTLHIDDGESPARFVRRGGSWSVE